MSFICSLPYPLPIFSPHPSISIPPSNLASSSSVLAHHLLLFLCQLQLASFICLSSQLLTSHHPPLFVLSLWFPPLLPLLLFRSLFLILVHPSVIFPFPLFHLFLHFTSTCSLPPVSFLFFSLSVFFLLSLPFPSFHD